MRLVCPNCEAKYEVPDDAIPDTGRDVQCANCGHAWYQMRQRPTTVAAETAPAPLAAPVLEPEQDMPAPPLTEALAVTAAPVAGAEGAGNPEPEPQFEPQFEPEAEPEVAAEVEPVIERDPAPELMSQPMPEPVAVEAAAVVDEGVDNAQVHDQPDAEPVAADEAKSGYAVDESVLAILREEAERESNARRAETARSLEVQPDVGPVAASAVAAPGATPVAVLIPAKDDKPAARRDRLPDVEEINSTLRPSKTGEEGDLGDTPPSGSNRSGGFRSGFLWVVTVAMVGAGVYLAAPSLGRMVPSLAGPLEGYVSTVNGLRLELDGLMRSATVALNGG